MILLDTHVLPSLDQGIDKVGKQAREILDASQNEGAISVSAISFWEIAMLASNNRIRTSLDLAEWRQGLLSADSANGAWMAQPESWRRNCRSYTVILQIV